MSEKQRAIRARKSAAKKRKAVPSKVVKEFHNDLEIRLNEQREEIMSLFRQDLGVGQGATSNHEGEDDVDRANFDFSREMALSMSTEEREVLMLIGEALDRLNVGVYGSCSNCSRSISDARLLAIPWARHCVECQELEEKGLLNV